MIGDGLARLGGYPFEVRHTDGRSPRAVVAADAYAYLGRLFAPVAPDIALIVP